MARPMRVLGSILRTAVSMALSGELLKFLTECASLESTWVTGVSHQRSLICFSSCHDDAFGIRHDDVVACVDVRCVFGAMLAHEDGGDLSSHAAQNLTICVDMTPASLDVTVFHEGSLTRHGINDLETVALTLLQGFQAAPGTHTDIQNVPSRDRPTNPRGYRSRAPCQGPSWLEGRSGREWEPTLPLG